MQDNLLLDPIHAEFLKTDQYAILQEVPCRIIGLSNPFSKHGYRKVVIKAINLFNNQIVCDQLGPTKLVNIPKVQYFEYSLIGILDYNYMILLNQDGQIKEDIKISKEQNDTFQNITLKFNQGMQLLFQKMRNIIVKTVLALGIESFHDYREETD